MNILHFVVRGFRGTVMFSVRLVLPFTKLTMATPNTDQSVIQWENRAVGLTLYSVLDSMRGNYTQDRQD